MHWIGNKRERTTHKGPLWDLTLSHSVCWTYASSLSLVMASVLKQSQNGDWTRAEMEIETKPKAETENWARAKVSTAGDYAQKCCSLSGVLAWHCFVQQWGSFGGRGLPICYVSFRKRLLTRKTLKHLGFIFMHIFILPSLMRWIRWENQCNTA